MRAVSVSRHPQRRLAWLLWLALLLPIAQSAAAWHALQHHAADAAVPADEKSALHLAHCDLCLAGAAVDAGAPPSSPLAIGIDEPARTTSPWADLPAPDGASLAAYLSRAPPFASR